MFIWLLTICWHVCLLHETVSSSKANSMSPVPVRKRMSVTVGWIHLNKNRRPCVTAGQGLAVCQPRPSGREKLVQRKGDLMIQYWGSLGVVLSPCMTGSRDSDCVIMDLAPPHLLALLITLSADYWGQDDPQNFVYKYFLFCNLQEERHSLSQPLLVAPVRCCWFLLELCAFPEGTTVAWSNCWLYYSSSRVFLEWVMEWVQGHLDWQATWERKESLRGTRRVGWRNAGRQEGQLAAPLTLEAGLLLAFCCPLHFSRLDQTLRGATLRFQQPVKELEFSFLWPGNTYLREPLRTQDVFWKDAL